jgi:hypothetical protein
LITNILQAMKQREILFFPNVSGILFAVSPFVKIETVRYYLVTVKVWLRLFFPTPKRENARHIKTHPHTTSTCGEEIRIVLRDEGIFRHGRRIGEMQLKNVAARFNINAERQHIFVIRRQLIRKNVHIFTRQGDAFCQPNACPDAEGVNVVFFNRRGDQIPVYVGRRKFEREGFAKFPSDDDLTGVKHPRRKIICPIRVVKFLGFNRRTRHNGERNGHIDFARALAQNAVFCEAVVGFSVAVAVDADSQIVGNAEVETEALLRAVQTEKVVKSFIYGVETVRNLEIHHTCRRAFERMQIDNAVGFEAVFDVFDGGFVFADFIE